MRSLIIDNYDSYTYNLYQLIGKVSGFEPIVIKNDEMTYDEILNLDFDNVIISPGPGSPDKEKDFGICKDIIEKLDKPILGICLGHQGIYYCHGGEVVRAEEPMHGRQSSVNHNGKGLFKGIKNNFTVTRYHSLTCEDKELDDIEIDARTPEGIVMGISHKTKPIYGLQFHPESIASECGEELINNFINITRDFYNKNQLAYEIIEKDFDTSELYEKLYAYDDRTLWLDSSKVEEGLSRFSIFGLQGKKRGHTIKYDVEKKLVKKTFAASQEKEIFEENIFDFLKANRPRWDYDETLPFDFQLGYIGYFGYELKKDTENVSNKHSYSYPDAYLKYCDRALVYDHLEKKLYLLSYGDDLDWKEDIKKILDEDLEIKKEREEKRKFPKLKFVKDKKTYTEDILKIKELIRAGETYEVCLTNRLDIFDKIDGKKYYMELRDKSPGQYSAFLPLDELKIASSSMERFLRVDKDKIVSTKPIKGTIKRGESKEEDERLIEELRSEEKTKSENLMIVDLLRNDLGKFCEIGSVEVPKLMDVETYKTLHQLVTTVSGKIKEDVDIIEVLEKTFPGGSMTGAPKKRTLEIIDELETYPRGVYSGTIGYISNNSTMDFNIVIRTALIEEDKATIGVGGAIILLSDEEEEFDEIVLKAKGSLLALQSYYNNFDEIDIEGSKN
ncbi:aminodeoxychorismate synthase component I [Peptoniphilus harei]|uniref:aminodeoxychorismate synthase component I n=1 Tax=Peptoniphilus harei TaxID=54005 RepID=UPI002550F02E|nr:aminodeoxychorismate synthase component I [Peptoniphilus harei]MDK7354717.1 aminodeoxychorismate synthase component I [Peptoniphilus harei]MDK7370408.1 aminodeoxychorismate synthase component I [Peptoniphilus harei]